MPEIPKVGEVWTCTLDPSNKTPALIASVVGQHVTFVSLTGVRVPVLWRDGLPWRKSHTPTFSQACSREGCRREAFVAYERPPNDHIEVVCPYHIPRGTQSKILEFPELNAGFFVGETCGRCHVEAVEVFTGIPRIEYTRLSIWSCQHCGDWWMRVKWPPGHEAPPLTEADARTLVPSDFQFAGLKEVDSIALRKSERPRTGAGYKVSLKVDPTATLKTVREFRDMYDYLLQDDMFI